MEFPFYVSKVLPASPDNITILDAASVNVKSNHLTNPSQGHYLNKSDSGKDCLAQIIDKMGEASSIVLLLFYRHLISIRPKDLEPQLPHILSSYRVEIIDCTSRQRIIKFMVSSRWEEEICFTMTRMEELRS